MKVIKEIVRIVPPKRTRYVSLMDFGLKSDSKLKLLYDGIRNNKFETDRDAIVSLYGDEKFKQKYHKLKYDLRRRLFNTIHLVELDEKEVGTLRKTLLDCQKAWTVIRFLINFQAIKSAIYILDRYFPKMQKFDFTNMVLEGAKLYRQYYTTIEVDEKLAAEYDEMVQEYLQLYVAETIAEGYFHELMSYFVKSKKPQKEVSTLAAKRLVKLREKYPPILSNGFIFRYKMIEIIQYMSRYDFERTIEVCREAVELLSERPVKYRTALMLINAQWISCDMQLGNYECAKANCKKLLEEYVVEGDFNWFKGIELHFQILMHEERFTEAYAIYKTAVRHKSFAKLPDSFREEWKLYSAYLKFLFLIGQLPLEESSFLRQFRLGKFSNEFSRFTKDKEGLNASILIAQMIILIGQKKHGKVIDRMESIEKYANRYLNTEYHFRTNLFIKLIAVLSRGGFDEENIAWTRFDKLEQELAEKPIDVINQNYDLEIIKYETLVRLIRQEVGTRRHLRLRNHS